MSSTPGSAHVTTVNVNIPDGGVEDLELPDVHLGAPPAALTAWQSSGDKLAAVGVTWVFANSSVLLTCNIAANLVIKIVHE